MTTILNNNPTKTIHFDLPKYVGKNMNTENSKKNEPHKFVYNLLQILDLTSSNKNVAQNNSSNVE